MRWDIDPVGVRGTLGHTEAQAREFDTHLPAMQAELEGSGSQCSSQIVAQELVNWIEAQTPEINDIFARISAAMNGAATATQHYVSGDLEMASNAERSAAAAPDPRATMPGGGR